MGDLGLVGFAEQVFKSFLRLDVLSQIVTFFALYSPRRDDMGRPSPDAPDSGRAENRKQGAFRPAG
jgi:hypothetical protein